MKIGDTMQEQIMDLLTKVGKALSVDEISDQLNIQSVDDFKQLLKDLNYLEDELKLYRTNKNKYMIFNNSNLKLGRFIGNKRGFGFVDVDGEQEDIYIPNTNVNNAINGDRVVAEITQKKSGNRMEGRIVRIVERKFKTMVGEYYTQNHKGFVKLDDEKVHLTIEIRGKHTLGAMPGHKVMVKITDKVRNNYYHGEILKILGHKNDPGVDILSIVGKYGIHDEFPEEVMEQLDQIPDQVTPKEIYGRRDLRNEVIFTIDGADAKDLDDAVSCKVLDNGHYQLGVHIADVSHYVKENTPIDREAYERGTSVYLTDRVIPMLPHKLSNGICSLNGGEDRLTITCEMEIDEKGHVVTYDIYESVICSKKRMTYTAVNEILENHQVPEGYEPFVETLQLMEKLSKILRKQKETRGYIDFEIDESKILVDEQGVPTDVVLRERGTGEKLIEDFMIAANETVATHVYFLELPFLYRIHGEPNPEKIQKFVRFVHMLGYQINGKVDDIHPKTMQMILNSLKDKREFHILSSMLLRSMQKAVYSKDNIGHFGLASKYYTHFTSPIRRYPDTTVHRLLRTYLFKGDMSKETVRYWDEKLILLGDQTSECERNAVECEREVDDMKKAEYMEQHIGEVYEGMISSVLSFGMFVELPNLIEGLVRLDDMKDGSYTYDETTFAICSEHNKRGYRLGDKVQVKVIAASKEAHTIDFELVEENNNQQ